MTTRPITRTISHAPGTPLNIRRREGGGTQTVLNQYFLDNVWTPPFAITENEDGSASSGFSSDNFRPNILTSGRAYVNGATGNDGTAELNNESLPYKTMSAARTAGAWWFVVQGENSGTRIIYDQVTGFAAAQGATSNIVIESWDGNMIFLTRALNGLSWSQKGATNVYAATSSDAPLRAIDFTYGCDGVNDSSTYPTALTIGDTAENVPIPFERYNHANGTQKISSETANLVDDTLLPGLVANDAFTIKSSTDAGAATTITIAADTSLNDLVTLINAVANVSAEPCYRDTRDLRLDIRTTDGGDLVLAEDTNTPLADLGLPTGTIALEDTLNAISGPVIGFDGVEIMMKNHDNRAPDADNVVFSFDQVFNSTGVHTYWFDKVAFWGRSPCIVENGSTRGGLFVATNCNFNYSYPDYDDLTTDPPSAEGDNVIPDTEYAYFKNCDWSFSGGGDGMSSFTSQDGSITDLPPIFNRVFAEDCTGCYCGTREGTNDNGFTVHNGATAAIDLNGVYQYNYGPNFSNGGQIYTINTNTDNSRGNGAAQQGVQIGFGSYVNNFPNFHFVRNHSSDNPTGYGYAVSDGGQLINLGGNDVVDTSDLSGGTGNWIDATIPYVLDRILATPTKLRGWYTLEDDFRYQETGGTIFNWFDASTERLILNFPTGARPDSLDKTNKLLDFGTSLNDKHANGSKNATIQDAIFVFKYKDGTDSTWDDAITLVCEEGGSGVAIRGRSGTDQMENHETETIIGIVSQNGAPESSEVTLDNGIVILRASWDSPITDDFEFLGDNNASNRGFQGEMYEMAFFREKLTDEEFNGWLTALAEKHGVTTQTYTSGQAPLGIPDNELLMWFDASDESTITESGGFVSLLENKANPGTYDAAQNTGANQPQTGVATINSLNTITSDGSNDRLETDYFPDNGEFTYFVVANGPDPAANGAPFGCNDNAGHGIYSQFESGGKVRTGIQNSSSAGLKDYVNGGVNIHAVRFDQTGSGGTLTIMRAWLNGGAQDELATQGNWSGVSDDPLWLCARTFAGSISVPYAGDLAEVLFFDKIFSLAEIDTIGEYLADKWGGTWSNIST